MSQMLNKTDDYRSRLLHYFRNPFFRQHPSFPGQCSGRFPRLDCSYCGGCGYGQAIVLLEVFYACRAGIQRCDRLRLFIQAIELHCYNQR